MKKQLYLITRLQTYKYNRYIIYKYNISEHFNTSIYFAVPSRKRLELTFDSVQQTTFRQAS